MELRRALRKLLILVTLLGVWGCRPTEQTPADAPEQEERVEFAAPAGIESHSAARALMIDAAGATVGQIQFTADNGDGVRVHGRLEIQDVAGGQKGFHVHEGGECEPPGFDSAEDHFDPHDDPHGGREDPPERRHVGDLGNIEVRDRGVVEIDFVDRVISLDRDDPEGIVGRSVIVHAGEDDLTTQPDGDAGDRIACGVVVGEEGSD